MWVCKLQVNLKKETNVYDDDDDIVMSQVLPALWLFLIASCSWSSPDVSSGRRGWQGSWSFRERVQERARCAPVGASPWTPSAETVYCAACRWMTALTASRWPGLSELARCLRPLRRPGTQRWGMNMVKLWSWSYFIINIKLLFKDSLEKHVFMCVCGAHHVIVDNSLFKDFQSLVITCRFLLLLIGDAGVLAVLGDHCNHTL